MNKVLDENVGCESLWYLVLMAPINLVTSPNMIIKFVHMLPPVELLPYFFPKTCLKLLIV